MKYHEDDDELLDPKVVLGLYTLRVVVGTLVIYWLFHRWQGWRWLVVGLLALTTAELFQLSRSHESIHAATKGVLRKRKKKK